MIPELNQTILLERAFNIKPLIRGEGELTDRLYFIEAQDILKEGFAWSPQKTILANGLTKLGDVFTRHSTGCGVFFKPSISEVLKQIPDEILQQNPVAFTTYLDSHEIKDCFDSKDYEHIARTTFYTGILPDHIKTEAVLYNEVRFKPTAL
jgi:hypothetical protein